MADTISCFIDCGVPVNVCNFKCEYCFVAQRGEFSEKYLPFARPAADVAAAFRPERFGGVCAINLCGNGETLLHPDTVVLAGMLLDMGHYVQIVTNATVQHEMNALFDFSQEQRDRLFLKFSFHYAELLKHKLLDRFVGNVKKAKALGISLTVELVAAKSSIPYIQDIKDTCMSEFGALCHVTDARDESKEDIPRVSEMSLSEHQALWKQFDSPLFDYRQKTWGDERKSSFCYSGQWAFTLSLGNGILRQCYKGSLQNIFENQNEPIHLLATGNNCPYAHCFNSHVWDCFAGVIPAIAAPSYASLRNRVCPDGTEWLSPAYKEIFGRRVCENYSEYNEDRKIFTNGIMRLEFRSSMPCEDFKRVTGNYLKRYGKIYIHGNNNISDWFLKNIGSAEKFEADKVLDGNIVVVSNYKQFPEIKKELIQLTKLPIISVVDLPKSEVRYGG